MMQLVLVRHGESEWNRKNLFTGWADVELSEKGVEEAIQGGKLLNEAQFDFDIVYTSYLKRAIHTIEYILNEIYSFSRTVNKINFKLWVCNKKR